MCRYLVWGNLIVRNHLKIERSVLLSLIVCSFAFCMALFGGFQLYYCLVWCKKKLLKWTLYHPQKTLWRMAMTEYPKKKVYLITVYKYNEKQKWDLSPHHPQVAQTLMQSLSASWLSVSASVYQTLFIPYIINYIYTHIIGKNIKII